MFWTSSPEVLGAHLVRRTACVLGACMLVLLGALTTHAVAASPTSSCPATYDAETASDATLDACGDTHYPLASITPLEGGGSSYNYEGEGIGVSYRIPPASFNPASASATELKEYGVPAAPATSSPEYPMWEKMIHNMHFNGTFTACVYEP
jgi:hypothetical protein